MQIKQLSERFAKKKSSSAVGLDIGNSSVKVVQLNSCAGTRELAHFDVQAYKSRQRRDIVASIKKAMETAGIDSQIVNTSVAGQAVIVRYIQMPRMTKEELSKALKLGVGKYIPFNLDEVNYDFQILDDFSASAPGKTMRVLLVAVKKEVIEERIKILKEANLTPAVIDVDAFASVNSFHLVSQGSSGVIAVLDIGADITSTTILRDIVPIFNRDVPLGGNNLTKALIEEFEINAEEADRLKHNPKDKYGDLINAVRPVFDSLAKELQRSFNYCESQLGAMVQKVFLTGGTAKFKGVDKVLSSILGIDVEIWDPTLKLQINESLEKERLKETGPILTVAVGLALRG
ncbi:MAG: type IV pilus assembly protein PilM [Candidatus Omnitrophica bacterium]|nr:type IV pilus assembly protein PilM [Candidatus Omnitrophota bacterium]MBU4478513.1 type IV pilus assembly protein PilM [Candidatus Omnitrophota bacterium]MCG2703694.1 type IV pilus assembly protein PilM [Candidatus Omnitrophota bacterium]